MTRWLVVKVMLDYSWFCDVVRVVGRDVWKLLIESSMMVMQDSVRHTAYFYMWRIRLTISRLGFRLFYWRFRNVFVTSVDWISKSVYLFSCLMLCVRVSKWLLLVNFCFWDLATSHCEQGFLSAEFDTLFAFVTKFFLCPGNKFAREGGMRKWLILLLTF